MLLIPKNRAVIQRASFPFYLRYELVLSKNLPHSTLLLKISYLITIMYILIHLEMLECSGSAAKETTVFFAL